VFYDPINDFRLKQCLKEKIGKFMERKERNAEENTFACQIPSFISAMLIDIDRVMRSFTLVGKFRHIDFGYGH
jgi:hypothetical protein